MPHVEILDGSGSGAAYDIRQSSVTLGRGTVHSIGVSDRSVSRTHAEIFRVGEMYFIRNLGSRNGTFVNEEKIEEELLRVNDVIRIGNTELAFREGPPLLLDAGPKFTHDKKLSEPSTTIEYRLEHADPADLEEPMADTAALNSRPFQDLSLVIAVCAEEREPTSLLRRVVDIAGEGIDADRAFILTRSPNSQEMRVRARFEREEKKVPKSSASDSVIQMIVRKVLHESTPILVHDVSRDPEFRGKGPIAAIDVKSVICAPLFATKEPRGVLFLHSTGRGREFTRTDFELIIAIALQVGIAYRSLLQGKRS